MVEVKCYLDETVEPEHVEPLEFWEINQKKYRNLANMAKDFLCIPATSVPAEDIFSQAGSDRPGSGSDFFSEH